MSALQQSTEKTIAARYEVRTENTVALASCVVSRKDEPHHYEFHSKELETDTSIHLLSLDYHAESQAYILTMVYKDHRLNPSFTLCMHKALDLVEGATVASSSLAVSALITVGLGRIYSNGLDLAFFFSEKHGKDAAERGMDRVFHFIHTDLAALFVRLLVFPVPTLAAINGHAYAGGLILALTHDYRIMVKTVSKEGLPNSPAYLCLNEIEIGVPLPQVFMSIVTCKIRDVNVLAASVLEARRWDADTALAHGVVHVVCPEDSPRGFLEASFTFLKGRKLFPGPLHGTLKKELYRPFLDVLMSEISLWHAKANTPLAKSLL